MVEKIEKSVEENLVRTARVQTIAEDIFNLLSMEDPDRGPNPLEVLLEELLVGQMRSKQAEVAIAGALRSIKKDLDDIKAALSV